MGEPPMSLPDEYDLSADVVALLDLVELDTTAGPVRLILNEDARFIDTLGREWLGSKLISVSEVEFSVNGTAPAVQLNFSFIQDPDSEDLIAAVKEYGVAAIKGRQANFYIQYIGSFKEFYKPVFAPQLLTRRVMTNLDYSFEGPQTRMLSLSVEGPFNLRAKPVGGRYNTADHSRRCGYDNPSLEFMPNNNTDQQSLFGL
jgi:hypothetical protein